MAPRSPSTSGHLLDGKAMRTGAERCPPALLGEAVCDASGAR
jgi:hypothetical protein